MTLNDLQRAAVVMFAAREVWPGSLDQMRAVCHILRNRVQAQWHEDYLAAVEAADMPRNATTLRLNDRQLGMLAREIDGIFYGDSGDDIARICGRQDKQHGPILYWQFIDRPVTDWFQQNIIRQPQEHRQRAQIGNNMYLFE